MKDIFYQMYAAVNNDILKLVAIAIVADTVFGVIRAVKEHKFNSSFGIDGAIRKISMVLCITFCIAVDIVVKLNFIGFLPDSALDWVGENMHINQIGLGAFFGVLFIAYEIVSILKNMTLCGLPTKRVYNYVRNFLEKYTNELPSEDPKVDEDEDDDGEDEYYG
jgi:toxin secretion/phage lysis holin